MAGIYTISATLYFLINQYHAGKPGTILLTPIDELVPFDPRWVWLYYLYYPIIAFPILIVKSREELVRGATAFVISGLVTSAFFLLWRTQMIRPEITETDFASRLLLKIYCKDNPYNCFPSQHVTYSWTAALITFRYKKALGAIGLLIAFAISLSTMFVKQHWFLDLPSGVAVAIIACYIAYKSPLVDKMVRELR